MRRWALVLCSVGACALHHPTDAPGPATRDRPEAPSDGGLDAPEIAQADAPDDGTTLDEGATTTDAGDAADDADVPDAGDAADDADVPVTPDVADAPALTFTLATSGYETTTRAGGNDGTDRAQLCNADEVMVGLRIRWIAGAFVYGLATRCAALRADGTLGAARELGYNGPGWPAGNNADDCPAGAAVVGLAGRSGGAVDRLGLQCAPVSTWLATRTVTATTPQRGGGGGTAFASACPMGAVGRGVLFDEDAYAAAIARLQLSCARVTRAP